ncbi:MAG TPA: acyl-CoA thioesterase [Leptospiraceae bacterium]|nr:acyl-CoA thioesterase [Leptospiraceae bacterium]HMZ66336.1 acyl-CoA thioesterase [Leptospiraceae bacterium]HNA05860.1 acyl-CoA thioesterase [Leptospiraceae bacterium]HNE54939.1 acyl-CoA thioesterase [Leptospiraceae bacterium]HNG99216.1 acyl-CoA thioesterase [Leptospiraceae bacterium]
MSPMNYDRSPTGLYRVRFQDCDPFGHLNNARYIDYALDAREDQLRRYYGFDTPSWTQSAGKGWVVSKMKANYLKSILWNEEIRISTKLVELGEGSLWVEAIFSDPHSDKLKSLVWGNFVYIDIKSGRPVRHESDLKEFLNSILYTKEWEGKEDIDRRVQSLRRNLVAV